MSVKLPADVTAAESYATRRIKNAQEKVKEAEQQAEENLKQVHDRFESQAHQESMRSQLQRETTEQKAYEELKDLKNKVSRVQHRMTIEGQQKINDTQDFYDGQVGYQKKLGDRALRGANEQYSKQLDHVNREAEHQIALTRVDQGQRVEKIKKLSDEQFQKIIEERQSKEAEIRAKSEEATRESERHYNSSTTKLINEHNANLNKLNDKTTEQLRNVQDQYAAKLGAYADRARDPFYRMVEVDASVREDSDFYYLIANVPKHEQDRVSVTVKGGTTLVINGTRNTTDRQELPDGSFKTTSSNQSYTQTFPVDHPVDERAVMRDTRGDQIIFTIPKRSRPASPQYQAAHAEKAKGIAPKFPENLPIQTTKKDRPLS